MANPNTPFGLRPVRYLSGAPWNGKARRYQIAASYGYAIGIGTCVDLAGSSSADGTTPTVARVTAGATYPILGVVVALEPDPTNLTSLHFVASTATARYCYVVDDPDVIFEAQVTSTSTIAYTDVGLNTYLVDSSPVVNATTGVDGATLYATPSADATYQLLIMNASDRPDNDITLPYGKFEVMISLHRLKIPYDAHASAYYGLKGA